MPQLSILFLGDDGVAEFADASQCLEPWGAVHEFSALAEAETALSDGVVVPDAIVVAQCFPGRYSHEAVDRLRRAAPLARVIGLMGSWCEGEMRTGSPWPGAVRTYWHQWQARCNRELRRLSEGQTDSWALPPTATEEERSLAAAVEPWTRRHGTIVIAGRSRESAKWLSDACRRRGYAACLDSATAAHVSPTAAIFDAPDLLEQTFNDLHRLAGELQPAPVVALMSFPRIEDRDRALSAGAAAVVSKPLMLNDLFGELDRVAAG